MRNSFHMIYPNQLFAVKIIYWHHSKEARALSSALMHATAFITDRLCLIISVDFLWYGEAAHVLRLCLCASLCMKVFTFAHLYNLIYILDTIGTVLRSVIFNNIFSTWATMGILELEFMLR